MSLFHWQYSLLFFLLLPCMQSFLMMMRVVANSKPILGPWEGRMFTIFGWRSSIEHWIQYFNIHPECDISSEDGRLILSYGKHISKDSDGYQIHDLISSLITRNIIMKMIWERVSQSRKIGMKKERETYSWCSQKYKIFLNV